MYGKLKFVNISGKTFRSTYNHEISNRTDEQTSKCVLKQIPSISVAKVHFEEKVIYNHLSVLDPNY